MRIGSVARPLALLSVVVFGPWSAAAVHSQEAAPARAAATPAPRPTVLEDEAPAVPAEPEIRERERDRERDRDRDRRRERAREEEDEARDERDDRRRRRRERDGDVHMGSSVTVQAGETHEDDIVVMGGSVTVAGTQEGDVVAIGGGVTISGEVDGDVVAIGGPVKLTSSARVDGDVAAVGSRLDKEPGAVVRGKVFSGEGLKHLGHLKHLQWLPWEGLGVGALFLASIADWFWTSALALLLALVIASVMPPRVEATANVLREEWLTCGAWGFLTWLASLVLTFVLCITLVGAVVPWLFYQIAKYFGFAALFSVVGHAIGQTAFKRDLSLMAALLLGFLALSLIAFLMPPIWWVYGWLAVGASVFTRFGTMKPWFRRTPPPPPPTTTVVVEPPPATA